MTPQDYIEQIVSGLSEKNPEELHVHFDRLESILKKIDDVPSPHKEELLVELLLLPTDKHRDLDIGHPSP